MAAKAYVLINARAGRIRDLTGKVVESKGVKQANACWGRPDIIALVEAPDLKQLSDLVLNRIQSLDGVESTDTHIVCDF